MTQEKSPDLIKALMHGLDTRDDWGGDKLHASDLSVAVPTEDGGMCARQLWLRVHGYKRNPDGLGKLLMFDHGNRIHEQLPKLLERGLKGTGWVVQHVELSLKGLLHADIDSGRLDTLLFHRATGTRLVLDFKTVRGRTFQFLDGAKRTHVLQVRTYIEAYDADGAVIIYIDREGQNGVAYFEVARDDADVDRAAKFARSVVNSVDMPPKLKPELVITENKGPDSVRIKLPWQCGYCPWDGVSCEGALPIHLRDLGIVMKLPKENKEVQMLTGDAEVIQLLTDLFTERGGYGGVRQSEGREPA